MRRHAAIFTVSLILATGAATAEDLVNVDRTGLALEGYDPVAFFTEGRALEGQTGITTRHRGATYRFRSPENKAMFETEPDRYAPAFGGFCAYGAAKGYTAPVKIETWQIFQDRLVLNYDHKVKALFDVDRGGFLGKADANWPSIVAREGK